MVHERTCQRLHLFAIVYRRSTMRSSLAINLWWTQSRRMKSRAIRNVAMFGVMCRLLRQHCRTRMTSLMRIYEIHSASRLKIERSVQSVSSPRTGPQGGPPARKIGNRRFRMARGAAVDSGAADNVIPRRLVRGKMNKGKIRPSDASRAGVHYVVANNGRIKNEGEGDFKFNTSSTDMKSMCF